MVFQIIVLFASLAVGSTKTCICNFNHPRVQIHECPSQMSILLGFMDKNDANTLIFGATNTHEPFCYPFLEHIPTKGRWAAVLFNGKVGFVERDYGDRPVYCSGLMPTSAAGMKMPNTCIVTTAPTTVTTNAKQTLSTVGERSVHTTIGQTSTLPTTSTKIPTDSSATKSCMCNFNHPRVQIHECPFVRSNLVGFMDKSDANTLMFGATNTNEPFCYPYLEHIPTKGHWAAVLINGKVGFVQRDYGERLVICPGSPQANATAIQMPNQCHRTTSQPTQTTAAPTSTISTFQPSKLLISTSKQLTTTKALTTPSSVSFIWCNMLSSLKQVQSRTQVLHPLSRHCMNGESESEGVIYKLCNYTLMPNWKKGIKVKDLCNANLQRNFIAVASFFHERPIDAGIFVGCNPAGDLNIIQQRCGTLVELKTISGYWAEDYYTILI